MCVPRWRNGRRGGLKILWGDPCGFESRPGHLTQVAVSLAPLYATCRLTPAQRRIATCRILWGCNHPSRCLLEGQAPDFWAETTEAISRNRKEEAIYSHRFSTPSAEAAPARCPKRGRRSSFILSRLQGSSPPHVDGSRSSQTGSIGGGTGIPLRISSIASSDGRSTASRSVSRTCRSAFSACHASDESPSSSASCVIPIAGTQFTKTSAIEDPLLKVPPASRGNRVGAPLAVPLAKRGEPAGGGQL